METPDNKATRQESIQAFDAEQEGRFLEAILSTEAGREIRVERALSNRGELDTPKSGHGRTVDDPGHLVRVLQELDAESKAAWLAEGWPRPVRVARPTSRRGKLPT